MKNFNKLGWAIAVYLMSFYTIGLFSLMYLRMFRPDYEEGMIDHWLTLVLTFPTYGLREWFDIKAGFLQGILIDASILSGGITAFVVLRLRQSEC